MKSVRAILEVAGDYKPGDPEPDGYIDRSEWAKVQLKAGLRQKRCGRCGLWFFPQQLSDKTDVMFASKTKYGPRNIRLETAICSNCASKLTNP